MEVLLIAWMLVLLLGSALLVMMVLLYRQRMKSDQPSNPSRSDLHSGAAFRETPNKPNHRANTSMQATPRGDVDDDRTVMFKPESSSINTEAPIELFPYLSVVSGPDAGSIFSLPYSITSFGRNDVNDVVLNDGTASRRHFEVFYSGSQFKLRDLGSTNGTLCNGKQIHEIPLEFGDVIEAADTQLVFTCKGIELLEQSPDEAISIFENYLRVEPEFLLALKNLAFLLERDIRRKEEAAPLWKEIARLENYA